MKTSTNKRAKTRRSASIAAVENDREKSREPGKEHFKVGLAAVVSEQVTPKELELVLYRTPTLRGLISKLKVLIMVDDNSGRTRYPGDEIVKAIYAIRADSVAALALNDRLHDLDAA
jgi:hypothetical protein